MTDTTERLNGTVPDREESGAAPVPKERETEAKKVDGVGMAGAQTIDAVLLSECSHISPHLVNASQAESTRRRHGTHVPHMRAPQTVSPES